MHAIRNLTRHGRRRRRGPLGPARLRAGVGRPARPSRRRATCSASRTAPPTSPPTRPRRSTSTSGRRPRTAPHWMAGGSYLVARQIRMLIETWDRTLAAASRSRSPAAPRATGAPLGSAQRARRGRPGGAARRPATSRSPTRRPTAAPACCAAATTSSTAPTGSATSTPACSSWPTSATRARPSSACSARCRGRTRWASTCATPARRCGPSRPGPGPAGWVGQTLFS